MLHLYGIIPRVLIVNSDSKYKMCPSCGLSNNPIKEQKVDSTLHAIFQKSTSLTCIVCNFTTGFKFNAAYWWNLTSEKDDVIS